ncbi:MAG TPA: PAC2 family protein [Candidatus Nanoarchaeia archaeon]|nr:PAC2 family protein [Candidatus Nanoarchaeia archaeon]
MQNEDVWIKRYQIPTLKNPVAIVGSPGLRSIGKLVVDNLVDQTKATLVADLYSTHLPSIYETQPSYAAHPSMPGEAGAVVESGKVDLPKVQFYASAEFSVIFVRGYHPNFEGQYLVAQNVVDFLAEMGVQRMVVVAGFGTKDKKIVCAANNPKSIEDMKTRFDVGLGYKGPFMGFSGLVFGMAKLRGIEAVCLFAGTEPVEENLEFPDAEASGRAVELLNRMLSLKK